MPTQREHAEQFASLHQKGNPLILFNGWDAGSAIILKDVGAKAVATGSWSVGQSFGYADAEAVPMEVVIDNLKRIIASVDLPVTLDFEGGYAEAPSQLKENVAKVIDAGAIGINFEDQIVGTDKLYDMQFQAERIKAISEVSQEKDIPLFINARTDLFLKSDPSDHASHLEDSIARSQAYSEAGAKGFFAPGLRDPDLIKQLCKTCSLPVNIMMQPEVPAPKELAELSVARISYGGGPYYLAMERFKKSAIKAITSID